MAEFFDFVLVLAKTVEWFARVSLLMAGTVFLKELADLARTLNKEGG